MYVGSFLPFLHSSPFLSPSDCIRLHWPFTRQNKPRVYIKDMITINNKLSLFPQEIPVINLRLIKLIPVIRMNGQFPNQSHRILHLSLHLPKCNICKAAEDGNSQTLFKGLPKDQGSSGRGRKKRQPSI